MYLHTATKYIRQRDSQNNCQKMKHFDRKRDYAAAAAVVVAAAAACLSDYVVTYCSYFLFISFSIFFLIIIIIFSPFFVHLLFICLF